MEAVLPANAFLRYNWAGDILAFGVEYDSQSYRRIVPNTGLDNYDFAINHSEFLVSMRIEHQFANGWGNFKAGYRFNFSTDFEAKAPALRLSMSSNPMLCFFREWDFSRHRMTCSIAIRMCPNFSHLVSLPFPE